MTEVTPTFMLMNARIGRFCHLITPRKFDKPRDDGTLSEPKYEVELLIPKTHPQVEQLKARQRAAAEKKWGTDAQNMLVALQAKDKTLLHNGDATRIGKPEYAGMLYLNPKNADQPTVIVSRNGENIATAGTPKVLLPSDPMWPYAGCMVNVELDIYAYAKGNIALVSATILGVQFAGHAPRLGNVRVSSAGSFGIVASDVDGAAPAQSSGDGLI